MFSPVIFIASFFVGHYQGVLDKTYRRRIGGIVTENSDGITL